MWFILSQTIRRVSVASTSTSQQATYGTSRPMKVDCAPGNDGCPEHVGCGRWFTNNRKLDRISSKFNSTRPRVLEIMFSLSLIPPTSSPITDQQVAIAYIYRYKACQRRHLRQITCCKLSLAIWMSADTHLVHKFNLMRTSYLNVRFLIAYHN